MASSFFTFKRFIVHHQHSSMRVGTDAVLLGAWAVGGYHILDIGSGCGVVTLMMAQRFPESRLTGIDIHQDSIREATLNARESEFGGRVEFVCEDVRTYCKRGKMYDAIVSNPPFYTEDTLSPVQSRSDARNCHSLGFGQLIASASELLADEGSFTVIIPMQSRDTFVNICHTHGLSLNRECAVKTVKAKLAKRVLLEFRRHVVTTNKSTLLLQDETGQRSREYSDLCKDFYL